MKREEVMVHSVLIHVSNIRPRAGAKDCPKHRSTPAKMWRCQSETLPLCNLEHSFCIRRMDSSNSSGTAYFVTHEKAHLTFLSQFPHFKMNGIVIVL